MNQNNQPNHRHTWKPAHRQGNPTQLHVRRRSIDGVRGEPFTVYPVAIKEATSAPTSQNTVRINEKLGSTAKRLSILQSAVEHEAQPKKLKLSQRMKPTKAGILYLTAVLVVAATGYVTFDTWLTNRTVLAQANEQREQGAMITTNPADSDDEAGVTGTTATDTKRYSLADYKVAADMPRAMYIKKLNMSGRILPMGLKNGAVDAPKNAYDAGWYTGSAKPGSDGAALFDGHASETGGYGLFGNLHKLTDGDIITVEMGDGARYDYKVTAKETVAKDSVDMTKALRVQGAAKQGATFIACAGEWIESEKTLTERLLVYTERM